MVRAAQAQLMADISAGKSGLFVLSLAVMDLFSDGKRV